ncbi:rhodanese protein [Plakobranchus ocellatus]|uniref:Rhodanese protein n=1 Tax=Plakobranchus ocellatus TaxID=259542 RepID=A0AAV4DJD0_9GAST|nr:rhodanese protein [Plakobranchus ocellatus]
MHSCFLKWSEDPSDILNPSLESLFGEEVKFHCTEISSVRKFLVNHNVNIISNVLKTLSSEALVVTERQLSDFLKDGDFHNVSENVRQQLKHCPLTNLIGESAFGDFDYDCSTRRNSSLHNRSAIHCLKRNKTMSYIEKKTPSQQKNIFILARSKAFSLRQQSTDAEKNVVNATREKFIKNQQEKLEKEINDIDRRSSISEAVVKHGGPCLRSEDVNELEEKLIEEGRSVKQTVEIFKNEIRYQKHINGRRMKFGTLEFMKKALKDCLAPRSLPAKRPRH